MTELPESALKAAQMADLEGFLENVAIGFHWDILDRLEDGIYIVNRDRRIMYWSAGSERITGYSAEEVLGRRCGDNILRHVGGDGCALCENACPLLAVIADGAPRAAEVFLHHKAGHRVPVRVYGAPVRDSQGFIIGAFETFSETTSVLAVRERVRQLEEVAFIDALTGVANRRFLDRELDARFSEFRRDGWSFGVLMCDVDRFKLFNDEHGHDTGDRVLKMVAASLAGNCRPYDLVGRWGGEEFLVIVGHADRAGVRQCANRARALVAASDIEADGKLLRVTISVGASVVRASDDAASLVARADELLYRSKADGRNRVTVEDGLPGISGPGLA
jgi:diguanylate cyclase (GGDEF)-like protein